MMEAGERKVVVVLREDVGNENAGDFVGKVGGEAGGQTRRRRAILRDDVSMVDNVVVGDGTRTNLEMPAPSLLLVFVDKVAKAV